MIYAKAVEKVTREDGEPVCTVARDIPPGRRWWALPIGLVVLLLGVQSAFDGPKSVLIAGLKADCVWALLDYVEVDGEVLKGTGDSQTEPVRGAK